MTKDKFFNLPFDKKCHYIEGMRQRLYHANTIAERNRVVPYWLIHLVEEFEKKYSYKGFSALFLGSLVLPLGQEDTEEIVCTLIEIHQEQLHQSIMELDQRIGLSWHEDDGNENS